MNLDEMLAASGITGGAAADGKNVKSGCYADRTT